MELLPNEEQKQIASTIADYLTNELSIDSHRTKDGTCTEPGQDKMKTMADMGWLGLGLDEDLGGVGYTITEDILLYQELGRQIGPIAVLSAALGARVAALAGKSDIAAEIVAGDAKVAIASDADSCGTVAEKVSGNFQILAAKDSKYVLFLGRTGAALIETANIPSLEIIDCLDTTTTLGSADIKDIPSAAFVNQNNQEIFRRGLLMSTAMLVGVSEAALDMMTEYAKIREQFGKPIGSFQAIRHPCAEAAVRCEAALSQLMFAAVCLKDGRPEASFHISSAAALAFDAAIKNCRRNIQTHGAMGVTVEVNAHLLLKRTHILGELFGSNDEHLADVLAETDTGL